MIPTSTIRTALVNALENCALIERVEAYADNDLSDGLQILRDTPDTLAIIVAGADEWHHEFPDWQPGNHPIKSECRNRFEILVTSRQLDRRQEGDPDAADLKDAIIEILLWESLGLENLIILPISAEPMVISLDDRQGREAWKILIEASSLNTTH